MPDFLCSATFLFTLNMLYTCCHAYRTAAFLKRGDWIVLVYLSHADFKGQHVCMKVTAGGHICHGLMVQICHIAISPLSTMCEPQGDRLTLCLGVGAWQQLECHHGD